MTLTGANFFSGDPYGSGTGTPVTDAQLLAVLGLLDRLAIQADWHNGDDFATLDNLVMTSGQATAVPEPVSLALLGTGVLGVSLVRRRRAR